MTESQVIDLITKIANKLSSKYKFDIFEKEDIFQQAFIEGIKGLENFDPTKGVLENFLSSHIKRRLVNFKRDNYVQPINPLKMSQERAENKMDIMFKKLAIYQAIDIDLIDMENENSVYKEYDLNHELVMDEIVKMIDTNLPVKYREDYLKLLHGRTISKTRKDKIYCCIVQILEQHGYLANKKDEWL